jgi:hypothetical protein
LYKLATRTAGGAHARRPSRWNWLLLPTLVMPLLTPLYNSTEPELWGLPFFYWYQLGCVVLTLLVTTAVYQLTKGRK